MWAAGQWLPTALKPPSGEETAHRNAEDRDDRQGAWHSPGGDTVMPRLKHEEQGSKGAGMRRQERDLPHNGPDLLQPSFWFGQG